MTCSPVLSSWGPPSLPWKFSKPCQCATFMVWWVFHVGLFTCSEITSFGEWLFPPKEKGLFSQNLRIQAKFKGKLGQRFRGRSHWKEDDVQEPTQLRASPQKLACRPQSEGPHPGGVQRGKENVVRWLATGMGIRIGELRPGRGKPKVSLGSGSLRGQGEGLNSTYGQSQATSREGTVTALEGKAQVTRILLFPRSLSVWLHFLL